MEIIAKLGSMLGLSFISGINLYATVAVVGICAKYQLVQGLSPEFQALANDGVIAVAIFLYIVEFFADKIPGVDTFWDTIHTLIRPLGGAYIALVQVGDASPAVQVIAFMIGASMASAAHATKAGTRLLINTSPEPFSNIFVSLGEDALAVWFSYFSLAYPKTSLALTVVFLVIVALILPLLLRTIRMMFSAIFFRVSCLFQRDKAWLSSRVVPYDLDSVLDRQKDVDEELVWSGRAYAARIPSIPRFTALYAVITTRAVHLLYRRRFRNKSLKVSLNDVKLQKDYPGILLNKWLLRTSNGDWLLYLYRPLAETLPREAPPISLKRIGYERS